MPSKIKTILVDLDGVLANFVKGILTLHNKSDPWAHSIANRGKYDLHHLWNISLEEFWAPIHDNELFWNNLEVFEDGKKMFDTLSTREEKIFFCSSPAQCHSCHSGKIKWLRTHYPQMINRTILTNHKHLMAKQDALLIDDSDRNIREFQQHGGTGILFPRMWNSKFAMSHDPLKLVNLELNRFLK